MSRFEIVAAKPWHCGQMARILRTDYVKMLIGAQAPAHEQLRDIYGRSYLARSWLIDGKLAGLGGVMGTIASSDGHIWLALSQEATRFPHHVVSEARRQIAEFLDTKRELLTTVARSDDAAFRFAKFIGFFITGAPVVVGGITVFPMKITSGGI
jgi:hypothetical protein